MKGVHLKRKASVNALTDARNKTLKQLLNNDKLVSNNKKPTANRQQKGATGVEQPNKVNSKALKEEPPVEKVLKKINSKKQVIEIAHIENKNSVNKSLENQKEKLNPNIKKFSMGSNRFPMKQTKSSHSKLSNGIVKKKNKIGEKKNAQKAARNIAAFNQPLMQNAVNIKNKPNKNKNVAHQTKTETLQSHTKKPFKPQTKVLPLNLPKSVNKDSQTNSVKAKPNKNLANGQTIPQQFKNKNKKKSSKKGENVVPNNLETKKHKPHQKQAPRVESLASTIQTIGIGPKISIAVGNSQQNVKKKGTKNKEINKCKGPFIQKEIKKIKVAHKHEPVGTNLAHKSVTNAAQKNQKKSKNVPVKVSLTTGSSNAKSKVNPTAKKSRKAKSEMKTEVPSTQVKQQKSFKGGKRPVPAVDALIPVKKKRKVQAENSDATSSSKELALMRNFNHVRNNNDHSEEDTSSSEWNTSQSDDDTYELDDSSFAEDSSCDAFFSDLYTNDDDFVYAQGYSDDEDYRLPEGEVEDLIIHNGTAQKRSLETADNVQFDSEDEDAQIVEITQHEEIMKSVQQPKLAKSLEKDSSKATEANESDAGTDSDCPQLVPIVDEDGFQLYSSDSDSDDCYEEVTDDDDSIMSEDVNTKYLRPDGYESSDEEITRRKIRAIKAYVVDVPNCSFDYTNPTSAAEADCDEGELLSHQIVNYSNCDTKNTTVVSARINQCKEIAYDASSDSDEEQPLLVEAEQPFVVAAAQPVTTVKVPKAIKTPPKKFGTIFSNSIDHNCVLAIVKDPFYVYGTVKLVLIAGSIDVYGHSPKIGDALEIFSPRGCSSVKVSSTSNTGSTAAQVLVELRKLGSYSSFSDVALLLKEYNPQTDAVVMLQPNRARKQIVQSFQKFMTENVFPNMRVLKTDRPFYSTEFLLQCMINTNSEKELKLSSEWSHLQLHADTKMMIVGGKSVGKSTLLRYLINRHVQQQRILLIDLDIGQPEFFVPQTVSCKVVSQPLLGPGFFLNQQPDKAYFVGHTSIVLCAHNYLRVVKQLLQYCRTNAEYSQMPWLINTMGYNKGFGLELIAVISEFLKPTDIVQLQSNKDINNFDTLLKPDILPTIPRNVYLGNEFKSVEDYVPSYRLHVFNGAVLQGSRYDKEWDMSAKDMRYSMMLVRLTDALQGNAEYLTDCKPICAPLNTVKMVNLSSSEYTNDEIIQSFEANIVYLCTSKDSEDILECSGIGVVRSIDYHVQKIYVLPAMVHSLMTSVNCLAVSEFPMPTSIFLNPGPKVKSIVPFVYNTKDAKSTKSVKQIYHRASEFLTGKHKDLL